MNAYPHTAGYTEPTTSKEAAEAIEGSGRAPLLREEVLRVLNLDEATTMTPWDIGMTADEIAAELGESVLSVRPRVTELYQKGLIRPSGQRRKSSGGKMSHVWVLT